MFSADRRNMRVMVTNTKRRNPQSLGHLQRQMGRREIRMQIVRDQVGLHIEDGQQVGDGFLEKSDRRRIVEAADVLRKEQLSKSPDSSVAPWKATPR